MPWRAWTVRALLAAAASVGIGLTWTTFTASASATGSSCGLSGSTATVQLNAAGGTTTLSYDGTNLLVDGSSCGALPSALDLEVTNGAPAQTVVLDQNGAGGVFPCTTTIGGTLRGSDRVTVLGAPSENLIVGATSTGTGVDLDGCSSVGTVTGLGGYRLVAGAGNLTLSAAGGTGFTGALTIPSVLQPADGSTQTLLPGLVEDTIDFSSVTSPLTVNVSGSPVAGTISGEASTSGPVIYDFTAFGSSPVIFDGASAATTFWAGSVADTFNGASSSDVLSFANSPSTGPLNLCADDSVGATGCSASGRAVLGATVEPFSGIATFDGLPGGNSSFVAGSLSGQTFNATGTGNVADFSADTNGVSVDFGAGTASDGVGTADGLSGVSNVIGSAAGGNTFIAGASNESFRDIGTTFANGADTVDFSNVATSNATPLVVNVPSHSASVGATTYSFSTGASNFLDFVAPAHTTYLANGSPGYSFTGTAASDSIDFTAAGSGVSVDLSTTPGSAGVTGGSDTLTGLTTVTGSSAGGNAFTGGAGGPYSFTSNGTGNTFAVGTGPVTIVGSQAGNTVDFSALSSPLAVNVSGALAAGSIANGTAHAGSATYTFTSLNSLVTTFVGAAGAPTTFYAGSVADTFTGKSGSDVLDYANSSSTGPLLLCADGSAGASGCAAAGRAVLGATVEPFSGIATFDGLPSGNSAFRAGSTSGQTFNATGSGNQADFSPDPDPVTVDLNAGTASDGSGTDHLSGVSSVIGSAGGGNTFIAGTGSESFNDPGSPPFAHGADTVDFSNVTTTPSSPLSVNVTGGPLTLPVSALTIPNDTASIASSLYTFSLGSDMIDIIGSSAGNTRFFSGPGGGCSFTGQGIGNTLDTSAAATAETINLVTGAVTGLSAGGSDTFSDIQTFFGSAPGGTTFLAGNTGGYMLIGSPSGSNVLDLTAASTPVVDVAHGTVTGLAGSGQDTFVGIQQFKLNLRFTSAAPTSGSVGGSYAPTVAGTGSTQPIVLSLDAATTNNACSVSGGQVYFTNSGECVIDANQAGDGQFLTAETITQQFAVGAAGTSTTVAVTSQGISATVTSAGGVPTGTVTFSVDGATVGTAPLVNGVATLTTVVPSGSSHTVTALYGGNTAFTGSSGSTARNDPTMTATATSAHPRTEFGWYRSPVTISFTCTPTSAPLIAPCPDPVTVSGQGAGQSVTKTITATDGGAATAVVSPINIDTVAPTIHVHGVTSGNIYTSAPQLQVHATDRLSGVAHVHVTRTRSTHHRVTTVHYRIKATDKAGNVQVVKGYYRIKR